MQYYYEKGTHSFVMEYSNEVYFFYKNNKDYLFTSQYTRDIL